MECPFQFLISLLILVLLHFRKRMFLVLFFPFRMHGGFLCGLGRNIIFLKGKEVKVYLVGLLRRKLMLLEKPFKHAVFL